MMLSDAFMGMGELGLALGPSGRKVYVVRDFYATSPQQLSVFVDDARLEVLEESNPDWWLLKDGQTGHSGLVPAEIIEERTERMARLNCNKNENMAGSAAEASEALPKKKKEKTKKAIFVDVKPQIIVEQKKPAPAEEKRDAKKYIEYDPKLESHLHELLINTMDNRPGQLVKIYAGVSIASRSNYKTIRVSEDMTIQEMLMLACLKFNLSSGRLHLRHSQTLHLLTLTPYWRFWQVVELAKIATLISEPAALQRGDKRARKYYRRMAQRWGKGELAEGHGLKRHPETDFGTKYQFIIEEQ